MTSSSFPPGLLYIAQILPKLALSVLAVFIARCLSSYDFPEYVWVLAYILSPPATVAIKVISQYLREEREIKKLGARRVPRVQSHWPGGLDITLDTVNSFANGYMTDVWAGYAAKLGPIFNLRVFWEDTFITIEPNYIKAILATNFDNFEKGRKVEWYVSSVLGTGVFNSDGDMWKFHRGMTRPFFARDRVTDFEIFDQHAKVAVNLLKERFSHGEAIDFQDIMSRFTLDSATQFMFGSCVHSLSAHLPYAHNSPRRHMNNLSGPHPSDKFAAAFSQAQCQISLRIRLTNSWPLAEFWKDKTRNPMKIINGYIDPILQEALAKKRTVGRDFPTDLDHDASNNGETLLNHLVKQTDDHVILRDEILNIMVAGRDTTMATLTFVVYNLSESPRVLARLREEILIQMGPNRRPTFDDVKECKYMRAVINETLRLYPPVPFNIRHCKQSTLWPAPDGGKPYYIPAGVDIPYSVWDMHRRTDLWGPDAQEFDPDRFLDERLHKYLTPNPFIFLPFNAGPRICLGQQFAYNEVSFMLIRLLQAFDTITLAPDAQPSDSCPPASWKSVPGRQGKEKIWPKVHLTLYSDKGLWLRMTEAQQRDMA